MDRLRVGLGGGGDEVTHPQAVVDVTAMPVTSADDRPTTAMPVVGAGRLLATRDELLSSRGCGGMATVFRAEGACLTARRRSVR
jgi:hypothetical protein